MPNTRSAAKRARQSERRRQRNQAVKSATRTAVRRTREALEGGNAQTAAERLQAAASALDRAARKGVIHRNEAARRKSRLARRLNAVTSQAEREAGESQT
ncbi:30S ribosomal protein S20 [Limnochorda pilosa]|uniref:Small ribosomal subunit protein bS20 n=1 Tax=Limnochorda pilosa TaxID=1555112 RepID=A0A0K2SN31_LIMPI|nr:30S ribosomal protein S20 [Limnochorda pilosa]BAS28521.1 30S ribosomal protein S20 [Limnochorda pilosa]